MLNKELQQKLASEYHFTSVPELCHKYSISPEEVRYYAKKMGLEKKQRIRITDHQIRFIKENMDLTNYSTSLILMTTWRTVDKIKKKIKDGKL